MTGGHIPGSSRRCSECTRRRRKCDLGSPQCGPCQRGGLACSGPKLAVATFVNNASAVFGTQTPRQVLKTAFGNREIVAGQGQSAGSLDHFYRATNINLHSLRLALKRYDSKTLLRYSLADHAISRTSAQSTYAALLLDFEPKRSGGIFGADRVDRSSFVHYSNVATCIRALTPLSVGSVSLLDRCIFSLLSLYYGLLHGDPGLVRLARSSYTVALAHYSRQLAIAVSLPQERLTSLYGVLINASIALQVLEHLNDVDVHGKGHLAHIDGALSMLNDIGPNSIKKSTSTHAAFCGFRGIVAYVAIERRTPSFLAQPDWMQTPWTNASKTMRDRLNDIGLVIPQHMYATDRLIAELQHITMTPLSFVDQSLMALNAISVTSRQLDQWLYNLKMDVEGPLYWSLLTPPAEVQAPNDMECQPKYSNNFHQLVFSCGPVAGMLAQFWSFRIELLLTRIKLHEEILRCCDQEDPIMPSAKDITLASLDEDKKQADEAAGLILQAEPRLSSCFEGLVCIQAPLRSVIRYLDYSYPRNEHLRRLSEPKRAED